MRNGCSCGRSGYAGWRFYVRGFVTGNDQICPGQGLEHFAEHVRGLLRSDDGSYRMGGEEFVILLPGMDDATARKALPKLHQRLSGGVTGPDGPIRLSAGVATLAAGEDWSRWLARAENAMYRAKRTGRDRLLFALPP